MDAAVDTGRMFFDAGFQEIFVAHIILQEGLQSLFAFGSGKGIVDVVDDAFFLGFLNGSDTERALFFYPVDQINLFCYKSGAGFL